MYFLHARDMREFLFGHPDRAGSTTRTERSIQLFARVRTGSGTEKSADRSKQSRNRSPESADTTHRRLFGSRSSLQSHSLSRDTPEVRVKGAKNS
jgi:hypothetical protein